MQSILHKYSHITFTNNLEKSDFFQSLESLYEILTTLDNKKEFLDILAASFLEYTNFDSSILYNPFEFFDALIENDLLWEKFDDDEMIHTLDNLKVFRDYLDKKIDELSFLEQKYNIKIVLEKENITSPQSGIYWAWLGRIWSASIVHKLKKLLDDYPVIFIKNIKLHHIVIVSYFFKVDQYWNKTQLWWCETLGDNNIYLSYRSLIDSFDHELFHQAMQYYDDSEQWVELRKYQKLFYTYQEISKESTGFARNYGKENIADDQATIAEDLFLHYNQIIKRSETDTMLASKITLVKNAYHKLSHWMMNEIFWSHRT